MTRRLLLSIVLAIPLSGMAVAGEAPGDRLAAVLDAQTDEVKARYVWRHPAETLGFFGIEPGMTVVEALPGGGWYTRILLPYLGPQGSYIGADYAQEMFPLFGFFSDEFIQAKTTWAADFAAEASEWAGDDGPSVAAFAFGSMPGELAGQADAVLFIRALHNLARFEPQGGFLTAALQEAWDALKPGGVLGVVQHEAREDMPDTWAGGYSGYLKRAFVIQRLEQAGFEFVGSSEINQNERDRPTESEVVWRLPPSLSTSRNDAELRAAMEAIGESNRMTLKFRKPAH
jgi:predicted methyltransferase